MPQRNLWVICEIQRKSKDSGILVTNLQRSDDLRVSALFARGDSHRDITEFSVLWLRSSRCPAIAMTLKGSSRRRIATISVRSRKLEADANRTPPCCSNS